MEKHDVSDRSPSDYETHVESPKDRLNKEVPDPDAHLSEAERAAIVSASSSRNFIADTCAGSEASMEARQNPDTMALLALLGFLPGQDQHRQCEDRRPSRRPAHDQ